jgi:hypothetical protein
MPTEVFPKTTWIVHPWWMGHAERMNFMPRSTSLVADDLQVDSRFVLADRGIETGNFTSATNGQA